MMLLMLGSGNAHAAKRVALLVGANTGWKGDPELSYAEEEAKRLRAVLLELGGFADVDVLETPRPEELLEQIQAMRKKFGSTPEEGSFFLFYYSGHADEEQLRMRGGSLSYKTLYDLLREIPAAVKVGILDACRSGAILNVKGGRQSSAQFHVDEKHELDDVRGTVLLTSSGADELSLEARTRAGSFFTHHLVSALRGAADVDGDRSISLEEAYNYAFTRTLLDTGLTTAHGQHPAFLKDVKGRGKLHLTRLDKPDALLVVQPGKRCFVLTPDELRLAAEVVTLQNKGMKLALPAGKYVLKCAREKSYQVTSMELKKGESLEAAKLKFSEVPLTEGVLKGSQGAQARILGHRLVAQAELARSRQPEQLELSVLLAAEGLRRVSSPEARQVLLRGLERLPRAGACMKHSAPVIAAAWRKDGKHLATADESKAVYIWNPDKGTEVSQVAHSRPVSELAWSTEGTVLTLRDSESVPLQWRFEPGGSSTPTLTRLPLYAAAFDCYGPG
jgi:hypothetical protein